jgi:hypothetical protein
VANEWLIIFTAADAAVARAGFGTASTQCSAVLERNLHGFHHLSADGVVKHKLMEIEAMTASHLSSFQLFWLIDVSEDKTFNLVSDVKAFCFNLLHFQFFASFSNWSSSSKKGS